MPKVSKQNYKHHSAWKPSPWKSIQDTKRFSKENCSGCYQIHSNYSSKVNWTVHADKIKIKKCIDIEDEHYNSQPQPVGTIFNQSTYYVRAFFGERLYFSQSWFRLLDTGARANLIPRRYIPNLRLPFVENTSATPLTSYRMTHNRLWTTRTSP